MATKPAMFTSDQPLTPRVAHECDNRNVVMALPSNNVTSMTKTYHRLKKIEGAQHKGSSQLNKKLTSRKK